MSLTQAEIETALAQIQDAFPHVEDWQHADEREDELGGYTLWGRLVPQPEASWPISFFVTFELLDAGWRGALTVGRHAGFWTEAGSGDAWLLTTEPSPTLPEAIAALKVALEGLFRGLGER